MRDRTDEEIFEDHFYCKGGTLNPEYWPLLAPTLEFHLARARDWVNGIRSSHLPNMPSIYVGLVNSPKIQGGAFEWEGRGFIGLWGGTVGIIYLLFRRILADPAILPTIGDVTREVTDLPKLPAEPTNLDALYSGTYIEDGPHDQARMEYAANLIESALDFLTAHEYEHIAGGHCLLNKELTGNAFIPEMGWDKSDGMDDLTMKALEFAADQAAVVQGLDKLLCRVDDPRRVRGRSRALYSDPAEALYKWLFAIFTFFRLFGAEDFGLDDLGRTGHPHHRIRQRHVIAVVREHLENERPSLFEQADRVASLALADVERAYSQITGIPICSEGLNTAFTDPRVMDYVRPILDRRGDIWPVLEALTRARLSTEQTGSQ